MDFRGLSIKTYRVLLQHRFPFLQMRKKSRIRQFAFDPTHDVRQDIQSKYGFNGDLLNIYVDNKGNVVHKWHHYLPIYDRYLSHYRGKKVRFLEIGVSQGGSLTMWRKYFGNKAIIYGIDIDSNCSRFNGISGQVRIGSQDDKDFLERVIREMGGVDIVLDDGSHKMNHLLESFNFIFPKVNLGGVYIIEDLHTAYWKEFGGGYKSKSNFFRFVFDLIQDMHRWYHSVGQIHPQVSDSCSAIHIHDSIAIFEKARVFPPTHSRIS